MTKEHARDALQIYTARRRRWNNAQFTPRRL